ncbi:MAG: AarF/ABC1/UbiB kinase family protein [Saprospiraceae bacterium]|nr:AarF/ABC1/UbiB kinase family protein [Saprospiraceae bacterium]
MNPSNPRTYSASWRIRKAYWTAFVVMFSYLRLYLARKIRGKKYYEKRILALHLRNAERVKKAILELQGLFIKVGQLLSILTNFLPEAFQAPLEDLQDQIPARPYPEIQKRILSELSKDPSELFAEFTETPIAAASIGQAHRARLHDGTEVVVKVQHAHIETIAQVDLKVIERLTALVAWFFEIKGIEYAYTQVKKMIEEELDFRKEAFSMLAIQANLSDEEAFAIPQVHPAFSSQRVLTTTFHPGVKISNIEQIDEWGIDKRDLANRLVHAYCQMVFEDGFYHADPHPGNILVKEDGTLVLLDFGAVATLKPNMRTGLLKLIEGAAKNDSNGIIDALKLMEILADEREATKIAEKVIDAFRNFLQNEVQFDGLSFQDIKVNPFETSLFNLTQELGIKGIANTMQIPKDYVLLNRMVTLLLGICNTLDPHMNPIEVIRPYFQEFVLGERGDLVKFIRELLQKTVANVISLPADVRKTLDRVQRGELEVKSIGSIQRTQLLYALGQQFIFTILGIATLTFTFLFQDSAYQDYTNWGWGLAAFMGVLLIRSFMRAKKIRKRLELEL